MKNDNLMNEQNPSDDDIPFDDYEDDEDFVDDEYYDSILDNPQKIYDFLKTKIYNQDEACKAAAIILYNHLNLMDILVRQSRLSSID